MIKLLMWLFVGVGCLGAMSVDEERQYIEGETKNRIIFCRDFLGTIKLEINPRKSKPLNIGGVVFDDLVILSGFSINIGNICLLNDQSDAVFLDTIEKIDKIIYTQTFSKKKHR